MMNHIRVIIFLYFVALILIAISARNLTEKVTMLDDEINKEKTTIQLVFQNQNEYQNRRQSTAIMINQLSILKEMNQTSKEFANIEKNLKVILKEMIVYQHLAMYGVPPNKSTSENWEKLDVNQLLLENKKIDFDSEQNTNTGISIFDVEEVNTKIKDLEKERRSTIYNAVIFNISGLLFTHLAIILALIWGKD